MAPVRLCVGEKNTKRVPSVGLAMRAVRPVLEERILSVGDVRRGSTLRDGVCRTAQQGILVMLGGRSVCPVLRAVISAKLMEVCLFVRTVMNHVKNAMVQATASA